jgi:hypothetical protein
MRSLNAAEILDLWEQGQGRSPSGRGLLLLACACRWADPRDLMDAPLGWRNRRLLELHVRQFGPLECFSECSQCGERLEFAVPLEKVLAGDVLEERRIERPGELSAGGFRYRALTSADMLHAERTGSPEEAEEVLVSRCVTAVEEAQGGPPERSQMALMLAEADPDAEILIDLQCPHCAATWQELLDPVQFLWREIAAAAKRIVGEVVALAQGYGWTENEILRLSAFRRALYLEALGG